jgi:fatty acid-binding protein DegV
MVMDILKMKDINEKKVTKYMNEQYPKNTMGVVIKQLKYAIRGGRISLIKGLLATALKINVILDLTVKGLEYMDKALKIDNIFPIVRDVCQEQTGYNGNNLDKLCIYTSGSKEKQSKFKTEIIKKLLVNGFAFKNVEFAELPAVISVHSGPEYVGFSLRVK